MPTQDLIEWLDEQQDHALDALVRYRDPGEYGALWYVKRLSANDTQAGGAHQAGPYIRKQFLVNVLPSLDRPDEPNPRVQVELLLDSHSLTRTANAIWYNNIFRGGTRNETRITGLGGVPRTPLLNPELTGALTVFAFHLGTTTEPPKCHVWVCEDESEAAIIQERIGPVEPARPRIWPDLSEDEWSQISDLAQVATSRGSDEATEIKRRLVRVPDSLRNRAVEQRAMDEATRHYESEGWNVVDVSSHRVGYDIRCTRGDAELHVEVKGVTSDGSEVNLTRNEVSHAREYSAPVLYVLANIEVSYEDDRSPLASGGQARILNPWRVDQDGELTARTYTYRLLHP